ncbi:hypothetical protein [Psychrobacillus sp. NPDC093200]
MKKIISESASIRPWADIYDRIEIFMTVRETFMTIQEIFKVE